MLRLVLGKASTGKTSKITGEIAGLVSEKKGNTFLVVPEQYSHEAERELCRVCGDSLSLYAEVLSFTSFARKMRSLIGGVSLPLLDKGGKLFCMALAVSNAGSFLETFSDAEKMPETQSTFLAAVDELKQAGISPDQLRETAGVCSGELAAKLNDLALVAESYDAVIKSGHADPSDALALLAEQIPKSFIGPGCRFYFDGFTDFSRAEEDVVRKIIESGADVTVCLTLDDMNSSNEVFSISRGCALGLKSFAEERGIRTVTEVSESSGVPSPARILAENLLTYTENEYSPQDSLFLFSAPDVAGECELAAAKSIELVRSTGCRWRDIAVAVRGFDSRKAVLERTFRRYGVPLYCAGKTPLSSKPLPMLISLAYGITENGWLCDDMVSYLGTGLLGLDDDERDLLSQYILRWQLRQRDWTREDKWSQNPEGYRAKKENGAADADLLTAINTLRFRVSGPLLKFKKRNDEAKTASEYAAALADFLDSLGIAERLEEKAKRLERDGKKTAAAEEMQLWGIVVSALEQAASLAGEMRLDTVTFSKLFVLVLGRYNVGTIPVSLDRVSAGDFDRMRRRNIRHLIILGASDSSLPAPDNETGIFTADERRAIAEKGLPMPGGNENDIWREYTLIYNCLSLPTDTLTISYPEKDAEGNEERKSPVIELAERLFGITASRANTSRMRSCAKIPALMLALGDKGRYGMSASAYFSKMEPERLAAIKEAAVFTRGNLSRRGVEAIYKTPFTITATKADSFFSCKYAYFCRYGLKAKPFENAVFNSAEAGEFTHYVLEHVGEAVSAKGGFINAGDDEILSLTDRFIDEYIDERLNGFEEKTERFIYLFRRFCESIRAVVAETARELRNSDFAPLSYELKFFVPAGKEKEAAGVVGTADRVDGWKKDGKLYLRIADYKTGSKSFSFGDIWYGLSMQMILYLSSLQSGGARSELRDYLADVKEIVPAGVMYVPAGVVYKSFTSKPDDDEIRKEREKQLKRTGILLNSEEVRTAWEKSAEKVYTPSSFPRGSDTDEALVTSEQLQKLFVHVKGRIDEMVSDLNRGRIEADPYLEATGNTPCKWCDYAGCCGFCDGENGESVREHPALKTSQVWEKIYEEVNADE